MELDVRGLLWSSACAIADHVQGAVSSTFDVPYELEATFNGGTSPAVARHFGRILDLGNLPDDAVILDLGCGFGRIAMELTGSLRPGQQYVGLDPNAEGIEWARRNIGARHPNFTFERIDVRSAPYNPAGTASPHTFRFPFDDGSLDLVFMISVLTHVDLPTVHTYLREAARTLRTEGGRLVSTILLLDDEVEELIAQGRSRFALPWSAGASRVENKDNPELVIAHPRADVLAVAESAGFTRVDVIPGHWSGRQAAAQDFQDLLVADLGSSRRYHHVAPAAPPADADPAEQESVARLRTLGFTSPDELSAFVLWSVAVTLNARWWRDRGLTLHTAVAGRLHPLELADVRLRSLGIEDPAIGPVPHHFRPVDDSEIVALLTRTGRVPSPEVILAGIYECVMNGIRVLDGGVSALALVTAGREPIDAPIPEFRRRP